MGIEEMNSQDLRKLVDGFAKILSIVSEKLWQSSEVHTDWKRGNITIFKKREKTQGTTGQFVSPLCCQNHGADAPGNTRHMENKEVIGDSQHGFAKGKLRLNRYGVLL